MEERDLESINKHSDYIYQNTKNIEGLQQLLVDRGVIKKPESPDLLDDRIYNTISLVKKSEAKWSYREFIECLLHTGNAHIAHLLINTEFTKNVISRPAETTDNETPMTRDDVLELTDILTTADISYDVLENFVYMKHIEPELTQHRKICQNTEKSVHWRLRKLLKLWISTYPCGATFEVLMEELRKRGHDSTAEKVEKLLKDVKKEIGFQKPRYNGVGRRRSSSNVIYHSGYEEAGAVLKRVIKTEVRNKTQVGQPRRGKLVQFAISLAKVKSEEKLEQLLCTYSDLSLLFKVLAIFATIWDVFFDVKFIYDCYARGQTVWWVLSCSHLALSIIFLQIIAWRYRKIAVKIRQHLGSVKEMSNGSGEAIHEDEEHEESDTGLILIVPRRDLHVVNNAAANSFPNANGWFRNLSYFPGFWPGPSILLHCFWIINYLELKQLRKRTALNTLYSKDRILTIYGKLIFLFYDSSHAGKMSRYEYFIETLPQLVFRTAYFLNMLMIRECDGAHSSDTDFFACAGLIVQLLLVGVPLTLFKLAAAQYSHFEDQRTFQLMYEWKHQVSWMLSSGLSTGSIVLALSVFCKMMFDSISVTEWGLICGVSVVYIVTLLCIRRPSFNWKEFWTSVRYRLSVASDFLSPVDLKFTSEHFLSRFALLLILLVVSVLTGPNLEAEKLWPNRLIALSFVVFVGSGGVQWLHKLLLRSSHDSIKQKYN